MWFDHVPNWIQQIPQEGSCQLEVRMIRTRVEWLTRIAPTLSDRAAQKALCETWWRSRYKTSLAQESSCALDVRTQDLVGMMSVVTLRICLGSRPARAPKPSYVG